jgi:hypothetical protein
MDRKTERHKQELLRAEQFRRKGRTLLAAKALRNILAQDSVHHAANYREAIG